MESSTVYSTDGSKTIMTITTQDPPYVFTIDSEHPAYEMIDMLPKTMDDKLVYESPVILHNNKVVRTGEDMKNYTEMFVGMMRRLQDKILNSN